MNLCNLATQNRKSKFQISNHQIYIHIFFVNAVSSTFFLQKFKLYNMSDIMELSDDIRNIFCKYKEKQKADLFRTLNDVKCCECGHQSRMRNVQNKVSM